MIEQYLDFTPTYNQFASSWLIETISYQKITKISFFFQQKKSVKEKKKIPTNP